MTLYVEYFLIQTCIINFCILKLIKTTTKHSSSFFKFVIASFIGSLIHTISIQILQNKLVLNVLEFMSVIVMLKISFKTNIKSFIYDLILTYIFSFSLYGFSLTLNSQTYYTSFGTVTTCKFGVDSICLIIIIGSYIYDLVLKHIKLKINNNSLIYSIKLTHAMRNVTTQAFLDTGNCLNFNGNPVVVLDLNTFLDLYNSDLISFLSSKSDTISTSTVNSQNSLKLFKIDKIEIKNKNQTLTHLNQYVAVNCSNCFKNSEYKALISPSLI